MPLVPLHLNHTRWLWLIYKTFGFPARNDGKFREIRLFSGAGFPTACSER